MPEAIGRMIYGLLCAFAIVLWGAATFGLAITAYSSSERVGLPAFLIAWVVLNFCSIDVIRELNAAEEL